MLKAGLNIFVDQEFAVGQLDGSGLGSSGAILEADYHTGGKCSN